MFSCDNCGETWDTDPRLAIACPRCQAPAGHPCKRPSGYTVWGDPHVEREQAALDAGLMSMCTAAVETAPILSPSGRQARLI